jgi:hypothetical protein
MEAIAQAVPPLSDDAMARIAAARPIGRPMNFDPRAERAALDRLLAVA